MKKDGRDRYGRGRKGGREEMTWRNIDGRIGKEARKMWQVGMQTKG